MAHNDVLHSHHGINDAWTTDDTPGAALDTGADYNAVLTFEPAGTTWTSLANGIALGPTTDGLNLVYFITGLTSAGALDYTDHNYWNWKGTNPATYGGSSTGYAHEWTPGSTVTYWFNSGSSWTTAEQAAFTDALNLVSAVSNIHFSLSNAATLPAGALDIVRSTTSGSAFTSASYSFSITLGMGLIGSATTTIDTKVSGWTSLGSFSVKGGYGPETVMHEMLTAVGLGRPGPYNATSPATSQVLYTSDTRQYTVMSYVDPGSKTANAVATRNGDTASPADFTNSNGTFYQTTMGQYDILALQRLYGASTTGPLTSGETFGFNASTTLKTNMPQYDFTVNSNPVVTIYDSGTGNTLDLSGFSAASTVDLNPGQFSSANGMVDNIGIDFSTWIDTAIGGSGNDTFYLNPQADTINGGAGKNTVVFGADEATYTLALNAGTVTVSSLGITDTLSNIQTLQFADASLLSSSIPCFARGTRILTPTGEVAVELLREGDLVCTQTGGTQAIKWIGTRTINLAAHPHPPATAPIRISSNAISDGIPRRDLLLSPDHALFLSGALIPAVLLLNGSNIVQELDTPRITYLHVELDRHDILLAEALAVESYLDTGNRATFSNAGMALLLHPDFSVRTGLKSWQHDACAPLLTEGAELAAVRQRLMQRAIALGAQIAADPCIHVVTGERSLTPVAIDGDRHVFALPAGCRRFHVRSRSAVPVELGTHSNDRRRLGVAIAGMTLTAGGEHLDIPIDHPSLVHGWHAVERQGTRIWRWTDGAGLISLASPANVGTLIGIYIYGQLPGYRTPRSVAA